MSPFSVYSKQAAAFITSEMSSNRTFSNPFSLTAKTSVLSTVMLCPSVACGGTKVVETNCQPSMSVSAGAEYSAVFCSETPFSVNV